MSCKDNEDFSSEKQNSDTEDASGSSSIGNDALSVDSQLERRAADIETQRQNGYRDPSDWGYVDEYYAGTKLIVLVVTLMLGQFVMSIDTTIIATAVPTITSEFHSLPDIGWYGSAYTLATLAMLPIFGKIYSDFDMKTVFILAIIIFELGSIVCATAPSSLAFILGRAIAGIGQAGMTSGGMAVIGRRVKLQKRAMYFGLVSSMDGVASLIGPPLGGVITDARHLGWRFCFWINVPLALGVLTVVTGIVTFTSPSRLTAERSVKQKLRSMDVLGALLFITSMTCLFIALQKGGTEFRWSDPQAYGWLVGFLASLAVFVLHEIRLGAKAAIPVMIFRDRTVVLSGIFACLAILGLTTHAFYLPFYFQVAKGVSAARSGLFLVPYLASVTVSSIVVGVLVPIIGRGVLMMWFGCAVFTIASGLLTTLTPDSTPAKWATYEILAGLGFGSTVQLSAVAMQVRLPSRLVMHGNSLLLFNVFLGAALAVSLGQNIFNDLLRAQLSERFNKPMVERLVGAGATAVREVAGTPAQIDAARDAYGFALSKVFFVPVGAGAGMFVCTLGMKWWNVNDASKDGPAPTTSTSSGSGQPEQLVT